MLRGKAVKLYKNLYNFPTTNPFSVFGKFHDFCNSLERQATKRYRYNRLILVLVFIMWLIIYLVDRSPFINAKKVGIDYE